MLEKHGEERQKVEERMMDRTRAWFGGRARFLSGGNAA